jgi:hypothetical protein
MIDILVPVLGRPHNAQPLVDSAAATAEPYRVVFVCSPNDSEQIAACQATGAETMIVDWNPGKGDCARKLNYAFLHTDSEWVFQGADDIRFSPMWDHQALMLARKRDKQVIGTNDLHNPAVKRRLQSTHTLFARSYIDRQGGTIDSTGVVFCELYDHQFIDTEFVETARRRHVWAFSRHSVVEHLHPHWGLAQMDDTYVKAYRATDQDYRLYMSRMGHAARNTRAERYRQRAEERRAVLEERKVRRK